MVDYSKGQIYKIWDISFTKCYIGSSVQPLCKRFQKHKSDYKKFLNGECHYVSVFEIFNEFGVENCKIFWEEDYPCNSKKELEKREGEIQKTNDCVNKVIAGRSSRERYEENKETILSKNTIYYANNKDKIMEQRKKHREENAEEMKLRNKKNYEAHREERIEKQTKYYNEHKEEISEKKKQYRAEHQEGVKQKRKEYRENNLDKYKEYDKKQYEKHREKKVEYQREYRKNNPEKLKETMTCECGGHFLKNKKSRHEKSKMHQQYLQNLNNPQE